MSGSLHQEPAPMFKLRTGSSDSAFKLRTTSAASSLRTGRMRSPSIGSTRSQLTSAGDSAFNFELGSADDDGLYLHGESLWTEVREMQETEGYNHSEVQLIDVMSAEINEDRQLDLAVFPSQIETLSLLRCGLEAIDGCVLNLPVLTNLKRLNLNRNKLTSEAIESSGIQHLSVLTSLQLSHNELVTIPSAVTSLTSLQHLSVSHNKLETIEDDMKNMEKLEVLALNHNNLKKLCNGMLTLRFLKFLDISYNLEMSVKPSEIEFLKTRAYIYNDKDCGFRLSVISKDQLMVKKERNERRNSLYRSREGKELEVLVRTLRKKSNEDINALKLLEDSKIVQSSVRHRGLGVPEALERTRRIRSPHAGRTLRTSSSHMLSSISSLEKLEMENVPKVGTTKELEPLQIPKLEITTEAATDSDPGTKASDSLASLGEAINIKIDIC